MYNYRYWIASFPPFSASKPIQSQFWPRSVESADDSLAGHDVGSSHAADTPQKKKKPRKEVRSMSSRIKINDPAPNPSHAPTPSESTDGMFNLHRSNRWA
jgi:hypothetical protein